MTLLAISKRKPVDAIRRLHRLGVLDFGESYYSEGNNKIGDIGSDSVCWHFVGAVQSRVAGKVAAAFDWVHSVDRVKVAERLNNGREQTGKPLNVCIQVNTSGETSKSGVPVSDACQLAEKVSPMENLRLRGLMSLPQATNNQREQQEAFQALRQLKDRICSIGIPMDTLSMGMSGDFEAAIREGSTIVRVGTALFGSRD